MCAGASSAEVQVLSADRYGGGQQHVAVAAECPEHCSDAEVTAYRAEVVGMSLHALLRTKPLMPTKVTMVARLRCMAQRFHVWVCTAAQLTSNP